MAEHLHPVGTTPDLLRLIALACRAPSLRNSQPWRWEVAGTHVELWADPTRRIPHDDPHGRNLVISCGAALHHLRVAAAAHGQQCDVVRLPAPQEQPDLLACVHLTPRPGEAARPTSPEARADLDALEQRRTDWRRFTSWPVSATTLAPLMAAGTRGDTRVSAVAGAPERMRVDLLVSRAGVGREAEGRGSDGLLCVATRRDDALAWLEAGESLSAVWLRATRAGLSVVPLSRVIEVPETRLALQHAVVTGRHLPQVLMRVGWQELGRRELPATPRRPLAEVVTEVSRLTKPTLEA